MKLPSLWSRDQHLISGPFRSLRPMMGRLRGKNVTNPFAKPPAVLGRLKAVERILE